jgi:deoxycytidylate deaminase
MATIESDEDYFSPPTYQEYADMDNPYMKAAKEYARLHSLDKTMPNSSIIVKEGKIVAQGANGSTYHDTHVCERVRLKIPTGQGYELCEGCHPKNHGEARAIADAEARSVDVSGGDLYLWGHWWLCRWCRERLSKVGIKKIFLLKNAEVLFNKNKGGNIIGKQFD